MVIVYRNISVRVEYKSISIYLLRNIISGYDVIFYVVSFYHFLLALLVWKQNIYKVIMYLHNSEILKDVFK